jgi:hypothetical protein
MGPKWLMQKALMFLRYEIGDGSLTVARSRGVHLRSDLTLTLQPSTASVECGVDSCAANPRRACASGVAPALRYVTA